MRWEKDNYENLLSLPDTQHSLERGSYREKSDGIKELVINYTVQRNGKGSVLAVHQLLHEAIFSKNSCGSDPQWPIKSI